MANKIKCTCGHSWNKSDSSKKDMYVCHVCGNNNVPKAQVGDEIPASKITPEMIKGWEEYRNYLDAKGLYGDPRLNTAFGKKTFIDWATKNPNYGVNWETLPIIGEELGAQKKNIAKALNKGLVSLNVPISELNPTDVTNAKSKNPWWPGTEFTAQGFTEHIEQVLDPKGKVIKKQNFGILPSTETYDKLRISLDSVPNTKAVPLKKNESGGWLSKYDVPKAQDGITEDEKNKVISYMTGKSAPAKKTITQKEANKIVSKGPKPAVATNTREQAVAKRDAWVNNQIKQNEESEKQRVAERKSAVNTLDNNKPFTFPSGKTKNYEDMDWREKSYIAGKALEQRGRFNEDEEAWYDEFINPLNFLGGMSSGIGTAPYVARETNSVMPYVTGFGTPLLAGAGAGAGAKNVTQFTNNLFNPLADAQLFGSSSLAEDINRALLGRRFYSGAMRYSRGLDYGLTELLNKKLSKKPGRKFSEIFPRTEDEIKAANLRAQQAGDEGVQFVKDWTYDEFGNIRPDVKEKIEDIFMDEGIPLKEKFFRPNYTRTGNPMEGFGGSQIFSPFDQTMDVIMSSRTSDILKNPYIDDARKKYLIDERHTMGGVNSTGPYGGTSITFSNSGPYYYKPSFISEVAGHETGHTMQNLGGQRLKYVTATNANTGLVTQQRVAEPISFGELFGKRYPEYKYVSPNKDTKIGKEFAKVMVEPEVGKGIWEASPNELHSELMVARKKLYDYYTKGYNMDPKVAMATVKNHTDKQLDWMIENQNLDRFFKKDVTKEEKYKLLRKLPALIPAVGLGTAASAEQNKNGGWLDKYEDGGEYLGTTNKGFDYNGAWGGPSMQDGGDLTFLEPTSRKLPKGHLIPYADSSTELAVSIGGENGEPAYLVPSFKYGKRVEDPAAEFRRTGEHLGGPFKTYQEADEWERTVRHPYVEKSQTIPTPIKRWGDMAMGGSLPGSVGFTYARTGSIPSNGPYAKKTKASAQDGNKTPKKKKTLILAENDPNHWSNSAANPFMQEANIIKNYVNKYFPKEDVEIIPAYKQNLKEALAKSNPDTRLVVMGHYGGNMFGVPSDEFIKSIGESTYENCYAGICHANTLPGLGRKPSSRINEYNMFDENREERYPESYNLDNFFMRDDNSWFGFAPVERGGEEGFRDSFFRRTINPEIKNLNDEITRIYLNQNTNDAQKNKLVENVQEKINKIYQNKPSANFEEAADASYLKYVPFPARTFQYRVDPLKFNPQGYTPKQKNGGEMKFYQEGLDWKPRNISRDGSEIPKAQVGLKALAPITADDVSKFFSLFSIPQKTLTKLVTGEYQTPSEAMNVTNPVGAFAIDAVLDPVNLIGAGVAGKVYKTTKAANKTLKPELSNYAVRRAPYKFDVSKIGHLPSKQQDKISKAVERSVEAIRDNAEREASKRHGSYRRDRVTGKLSPVLKGDMYMDMMMNLPDVNLVRRNKKGGKIKKDDMGYWNPGNWGKPVEIGSNNITMQGVYEPLLGISDTGDTKMMYPGEDYKFKGKKVREYPIKKSGGWLDKYK